MSRRRKPWIKVKCHVVAGGGGGGVMEACGWAVNKKEVEGRRKEMS